MKAHEFDRIINKLHMQVHDSKHRHAYFVHNGVHVARTKRSHGNGKFIPEDLIRKQLHVSREQFAGLYSCSVNEEDYIKILIEKRIIPAEQPKSEIQQDKKPS